MTGILDNEVNDENIGEFIEQMAREFLEAASALEATIERAEEALKPRQ